MRIPWEMPALAVLALVAACSSVALPAAAILCPEPKIYSADQQAQAYCELLALPADSVIGAMIADYGRERAELRACRGGS